MSAIRDAEVYFGFGIPRPLFLEARRLRWVHSAAAGVGSALYPEMMRSEVVLTNSAGVHAVPIAEYVVAGVLLGMLTPARPWVGDRALRQVVAELRKVVWPTQQQLITYFFVVLVFVIVVMAIVTLLDLGFGRLAFWMFGNSGTQ